MVRLNEQLNDATLKLLNSEKSCQQLCEERQLCDAIVVHLNEQLNDATLKLLNSEKSASELQLYVGRKVSMCYPVYANHQCANH